MERLWCYMFTKDEAFIDSVFDVIYTKIEKNRFKYLYKII